MKDDYKLNKTDYLQLQDIVKHFLSEEMGTNAQKEK